MEERSQNKKNLLKNKIRNSFEESIDIDNYQLEQREEKLSIRKKKIFNYLFSKRKEDFENKYNEPYEININEKKILIII